MFEDILTKEVLIKDYSIDKMTKADIARKYNTVVHTINSYLVKYSIPKNESFGSDITGNIYDRITAIRKVENDKHGKARWFCECSCGKTLVINASSLKRGLTKSCGCYRSDVLHKGYKDISASVWRRTEESAIQRGYEFNITQEMVWEIFEKQNKKCAYTGLPISFYRDSNRPEKATASIDRIDSQLNYTKDNIQIVHKLVNICKNWLPDEAFIAMCNLVAKNRKMKHEDCINTFYQGVVKKVRLNSGGQP